MIVVDASALIAVLIGPLGPAAARVTGELARCGGTHAPDLIVLETVNALRRLVRTADLASPAGDQALRDILRMRLVLHPHLALAERVWALRDRLTAYDAAYIAVAEQVGADSLITADGGLASVATDVLGADRVILLRDGPPSTA